VEKILLALFVALTGSLLLPVMRLGRIFVSKPMQQTKLRQTGTRVNERTPAARTEEGRFRPLTPEEKKEFVGVHQRYPRPAASSRRG
jgi:hypothetical protein